VNVDDDLATIAATPRSPEGMAALDRIKSYIRRPMVVRVTWWSNGTRAKEAEVSLIERGDRGELELHDRDKVTVERR
jgi:hypothetical protein